jgi:uncharacterized protein (TIGR02996 family)
MTDEEARKLRPGDEVVVAVSGRPRIAEVVDLSLLARDPWVRTRLPGGRVLADRDPFELLLWCRRPTNVLTANVYADFLDDHGHHEAAALLRQAFPLETGEPAP